MWYIDGKWYDLTLFQHPGGPIALELGRGRDASELFHSYHVFCHEKAVKVLQKYEVKTSTFDAKKAYEDLPEPKSMYDWETESEFAKDLKQRVEPVVKKYGVRGTWFRTLYYIFLWVQVLLCFKPFVQGNWLMLFLFPLTLFFCNVHCSHDGSHFAISNFWRLNHLMTCTNPWLTSPIGWYHMHTVGHHNYPNTVYDPDAYHGGNYLFRSLPTQHKYWYFKYQRYYYYFLMCFVTTVMPLYNADFMITGLYHGRIRIGRVSLKEKIVFWASRSGLFVLCFAWPFIFTDFAVYKAALFVAIPHMLFSFIFYMITQSGHITETNVSVQFSKDWYKYQVLASRSYATQSKFWFYVTGGINLQVEHHLFPCLNHWVLPKIQPIVEQCCKDHGIPYTKSKTMLDGFKLHVSFMRRLHD